MTNCRYLNLYTGNHGKHDGIHDYVVLITKLMGERGIPVRVESQLNPEAVNLVIDEFTNYVENNRIAKFKKTYPDSKIVFILTEFAERKWGVESFNHFGGIFDSATIAFFDVYFRLIRDDLGGMSVTKWVKLICYLPLVVSQIVLETGRFTMGKLIGKRLPNPIALFLQAHHRTIYFHLRYLGLKSRLSYADAVITSHEKIINGFSADKGSDGQSIRYLGVLYPEFDKDEVLDKLIVNKKLFIEVTGSVTRYRQKWINRINQRLLSLGLHNLFGNCKAMSFSDKKSSKPVDRGAYSLHPPQTRTWPYCSPTRIFRALTVDHNLPILTHHFHQNPIEDVCFVLKGNRSIFELYEMYADPVRMKNFIEPRVHAYNEVATARNDSLVEKLREVMNLQEQAR